MAQERSTIRTETACRLFAIAYAPCRTKLKNLRLPELAHQNKINFGPVQSAALYAFVCAPRSRMFPTDTNRFMDLPEDSPGPAELAAGTCGIGPSMNLLATYRNPFLDTVAATDAAACRHDESLASAGYPASAFLAGPQGPPFFVCQNTRTDTGRNTRWPAWREDLSVK